MKERVAVGKVSVGKKERQNADYGLKKKLTSERDVNLQLGK